jgi:hypothetical protein
MDAVSDELERTTGVKDWSKHKVEKCYGDLE